MEPEEQGHPKFLRQATNWIAGLTALLVALLGLKAVLHELVGSNWPFPNDRTSAGNVLNESSATNQAEDTNAANSVEEAAAETNAAENADAPEANAAEPAPAGPTPGAENSN